jgi:tetratricopeptide (TPR) repeat protein
VDDRTAEGLLGIAERAAPALRGPDAGPLFDELERQYGDLVAALDWYVGQERTDESLRLGNALAPFWLTKRRFDEGAEWLDRVLGLPGGDEARRGTASINAGFMAFWLGKDDRSSEHFGRAEEIGRRLDDRLMTSRALGGLARVALRTDVAEGRRLARAALEASESLADPSGRSNAMHLLGVGAQIAGDLTEARHWMTQRLALVRELGLEGMIASEAANLSMVERQLGNLDLAEELVGEALEIAVRRGDEFMKPFALAGLAAIATERGDFGRAATLVGAAEALMETQGAVWPPDERPHYERMLATLPGAMGPAAFERARRKGHAMATGEAIDLALKSAVPRVAST